MQSGPRLETERLVLRRWQAGDEAPFAALCADPEVMRYIADGSTRSGEQATAAIRRYEEDWETRGFGLFALERKDDGTFLGFAGLEMPDFLPELMPVVEIGWRLGRAYWGRGYATEAARRVLDFGLKEVDLDRIVSIYQIGNDASQRVMEKIGLVFERETTDPDTGRKVRVYRTP